MNTETILVGGEKHEIATAPLTILVKSAELLDKIEAPGRIEIDSEAAMFHGSQVNRLHQQTERWFRQCAKGFKSGDFSADFVRQHCDSPYVGLLGLIDMLLKLRDARVPLLVKRPEANLHPSIQLELADFFIYLAMGDQP